MSWDPTVSTQLHNAFHEGDIEEFKRLLLAHPACQRDEDGADFWMWTAAMSGKLPFIRAMVELGLDVNESHDHGDPDDVFYEPEGPILQAATIGAAAIMRWLLDHGAKINYIVQGMPRCLPLIRAATEGHLDVVKLVVECGADVNAIWRGLNAIRQAEQLGHRDVVEYLKSVGSTGPAGTTSEGTNAGGQESGVDSR
jgi:ankyrin repeat protein